MVRKNQGGLRLTDDDRKIVVLGTLTQADFDAFHASAETGAPSRPDSNPSASSGGSPSPIRLIYQSRTSFTSITKNSTDIYDSASEDIWFERQNLSWVVDTFRSVLTTFVPMSGIDRGLATGMP